MDTRKLAEDWEESSNESMDDFLKQCPVVLLIPHLNNGLTDGEVKDYFAEVRKLKYTGPSMDKVEDVRRACSNYQQLARYHTDGIVEVEES